MIAVHFVKVSKHCLNAARVYVIWRHFYRWILFPIPV